MTLRKKTCVIVGSGLAGLYTAYVLSKHSKVLLLTKEDIDESNSFHAQGGIAAVTEDDDSPLEHFDDTVEAGRGLCDAEAVKVLTEEAPARIEEVISWGMKFDTNKNGHLELGLEGGHHHHRILHAGGDATGKNITLFMISQVLKCQPDIEILSNEEALKLLVDKEGCKGVVCYNHKHHRPDFVYGDEVILATGGVGALFARTTNPPTATGSGIAMAYEAGAEIRDMEFIQFHPTALYIKGKEAHLISEAVRGEGARLYNINKERFMFGRFPLAELEPRDVVARQIFLEMRRTKAPYVNLTLDHLNPDVIRHRFPNIFKYCADNGIDMTQRIPVAPAAHYTVGGITTDLHGRTTIPHLYAVGEVASTGLMGANRLASNSLIECLVFGKRVADDILRNNDLRNVYAFQEFCLGTKKDYPAFDLGTLLMENAGIIRCESELKAALDAIEAQLKLYDDDELDLEAWREKHKLIAARIVVASALQRKESRGGHYRSDYPEQLDEWQKHTVVKKNI
jgi:L-aspartate oxidase